MKEVEATLIICSDTPDRVVDEVGALTSVAGYRLEPQPSALINDYYVDTPNGALHQKGVTLRLRQVGSTPLLTLKGSPTYSTGGIAERLEIEMPWSEDSLARIVHQLATRGIHLAEGAGVPANATPMETLTGMGLELIQHRENLRRIRNIVEASVEPGRRLAELAIDSVIYHLGQWRINHYEVEVEAKADHAIQVIQAVTDHLLQSYPSALQTWRHGTLSTGKAIEALLLRGEMEGLVNSQSQLRPAAYQLVHNFLGFKAR